MEHFQPFVPRPNISPDFLKEDFFTMKRTLILLALLSAAAALFFGLAPLVGYRIFHLGVLLLLLYGVGVVLLLVFWEAFPDMMFPGYPKEQYLWWRILRGILVGVLAAMLAAGAVLTAVMTKAGRFNPPPEGETATVVVLGCLVRENGPSTMLRYRMEAALGYLLDHPESPVVVCGGQGEKEPTSEAQSIAEYLIANGIEQDRIYKEDRSTNTRENIAFSAEVIHREGLPELLVIVTDSYHQLRGRIYARTQGFTQVYGVSGRCPWGLFPSYSVREMLAVVEALVFYGGRLW